MANLSSLLKRKHVNSFTGVTLFCVAIALLLFGLGVTAPLIDTMVVSLCIGYGISGISFILAPWLYQYISPLLAAMMMTPVGLLLGLATAGLINHGDPQVYLASGDAAVILGVFFGIVGYLIFEARSRLLSAREALSQASAVQEQQEKALLSSELKLLQAQIEPHFLFNTLSNVIGLVHSNPKAAEEALLRLTTLLRSSLDRTRKRSTTLQEELAIVEAYLGIQQIRMPQRLNYRFVPELTALPLSIMERKLPPLIVQPLVENAILHGIDPLEKGGEIKISLICTTDSLEICVADTGRGVGSSSAGHGSGLRNVRERIELLYGERGSLTLEENQPHGVKARLLLIGEPK